MSRFDTGNVTDMGEMFEFCGQLTDLDVSSFNTSKVTDMGNMFKDCLAVTKLDLSRFDTGNVTNMKEMFHNCYQLTSLDLNSFNTDKVTDMTRMFYQCRNLATIYCNNDWSLDKYPSSDSMFEGCVSLVGGNGTAYDTSRINLTYARPDTNENQGYFTAGFEYTISSAAVGTLYLDFAAMIPEADHFEVYYAKSVSSDGTLYLKKVQNVIPAKTGVIIFGNPGTYSMNKSDANPRAFNDNLFKGVTVSTSVADLQALYGTDIYVLSRGIDSYVNFYKAGGSVKTIPANRAFLPYTAANGANELNVSFDENGDADGINGIETASDGDMQKNGVYNLAGQRVTNPKHGLYIVNGKKVYIP